MRRLPLLVPILLVCARALLAQNGIELDRPTLIIGSPDGDGASALFGVIGARRLSDGRIIIGNAGTNDIRVFDARGRHVLTVGRKGGGPGEFTFLQAVGVMRGDTLLAYDIGNGRITRFSSAGAVVGTDGIQPFGNGVLPRAVGFLEDGRMVAHSDFNRVFSSGERRDTVTFVVFSRAGVAADTLGRYAGLEEYFMRGDGIALRRPILFGRDVHASVAGRLIAVGSSDSYDIDIFDGGKRLRSHRRPHELGRVTPADTRALRDRTVGEQPERVRDMMKQRIGEIPVRSTYPAYAGLLIGRDGRLWVRRADPPGARRQMWDVFAAGTDPVLTVSLPPRLQPMEVGADYLVGRFRDELDVEYVHVYRIPRRPPAEPPSSHRSSQRL